MRFVLITSLLAVLLIVGFLTATAFLGPAVSNVRVLPAVSLEEAQKQVSFAIPQPKWLPDDLVLKGAHVNPPNWAQYFYGRTDGAEGGLGIEVTQGASQSQYVFPETAKQPAKVNGQSAFCVQGSWNEKQEWISTADAGHLEWSANGFLYTIGHSGLGLTCNDLIKIAESLQK
jgi:hypothetical protein